ncbi:MAG: PEGA domain-containing protein [Leptospirales bacterium]|nr:PEGA domain-containing protein [Leptospirales bacterium]
MTQIRLFAALIVLIFAATVLAQAPLNDQPGGAAPPPAQETSPSPQPGPAPQPAAEGAQPRISGELVEGQIRIESYPPGASVYINERLAGQTPMILPADSIERVIRVAKEGYIDVTTPVRSTGGVTMLIVLRPQEAATPPAVAGGAAQPPAVRAGGLDWRAFGLSLIFPGLGQASQDRSGAAYAFGTTGALGFASFLAGDFMFREGQRSFKSAYAATTTTTAAAFATSSSLSGTIYLTLYQDYLLNGSGVHNGRPNCRRTLPGCSFIEDGYQYRRWGLGLYAALWIWSALDALFYQEAAIGAGSDPSAAPGGRFDFGLAPARDASGRSSAEAWLNFRTTF